MIRQARGLRRLLGQPARRAYHLLTGLRRGRWYGVSRPAWWPRRRHWPLGPGHAHAGQQVTVIAGGRRYELTPATDGRRRGHLYPGRLVATPGLLAERLAAMSFDAAAAPLLAAVSSLEGPFDSFQTYAHGRLAWGCLQFTGTGGLPRLLHRLKDGDPDRFRAYFGTAGIDVEPGMLVLDIGGRRLRGGQALNCLHDEPALWKAFLLAGEDPAVHDVQIAAAYLQYYMPAFALTVNLGGHTHRLSAVLAAHAMGQPMLLDRAVYRGIGYTGRLFQRAARRAGLRTASQGPELLAAAMALEPGYAQRWRALQQALAATAMPIPPAPGTTAESSHGGPAPARQ